MTHGMAWLLLSVAGVLDVAWALSMKASRGYTRPGWTVVSLGVLAAFVYLLGRSLESLPVGVAYAVWTGIGAVGTVVAGALIFGEALRAVQIGGIALIVGGIVLLRVTTA